MASGPPMANGSAAAASPPPYEQWPASRVDVKALDAIAMDVGPSAMEVDRVTPEARDSRAPSTFSMDDIEVAKALTGMREASPAVTNSTLQAVQPQPEPLLTLLTSQHPLVATAIHGSLSAYSTSKHLSPRFVARGAEFVERNIASPAARISGVESGVRWLLQRGDGSHEPGVAAAPGAGAPMAAVATAPRGSKRRRSEAANDEDRNIDPRLTGPSAAPAPPLPRTRAPSELSQETLPAYDTDQRSPEYEERPAAASATTPAQPAHASGSASAASRQTQSQQQQTWQTRLVMSTSALGVAMSDESLRSLRFCLSWLRWANDHLGRALATIQAVLREWEASQQQQQQQQPATNGDHAMSDGDAAAGTAGGPPGAAAARDPATIAEHLAALRAECLRTLRNALDVVSTYAGGALPENARGLVRGHLVALPRRFQLATASTTQHATSAAAGAPATTTATADASAAAHHHHDAEKQAPPPEAVTGARRVAVLTREGLDMIGQVGTVVDSVITEAERWCERLGRRVHGEAPAAGGGVPASANGGPPAPTGASAYGADEKAVAATREGEGNARTPQQPSMDVKMELDERQ